MFYNDDDDFVDYGKFLEKAMRGVVRDALKEISKGNCKKKYCFIFEVDTRHNGVKLPENILLQYPETITLIIQHRFSNLNISSDYFSVDLSFGGIVSNVVIPFDSILTFSDRENDFELKFDSNMFDIGGGVDELFVNYKNCDDTDNSDDEKSHYVFNDNLVNFNDLKNRK